MPRLTRFQIARDAASNLGPGPFSARDLFNEMKKIDAGEHKDSGLWLEIAVRIVNCPPNWHWGGTLTAEEGKLLFFLRPDGRLERYDETRHGRFREGEKET